MQWVSALSKQTDIDAAVQEASEEIVRQIKHDSSSIEKVLFN